jgi:hypothetical protein
VTRNPAASTSSVRQQKRPGEPQSAGSKVKRKLENGSAKPMANGSAKKAKVRKAVHHLGVYLTPWTVPQAVLDGSGMSLIWDAGLPTVQLSAKRAKADEPSDDEDSGSARTTGRQRKRQVPLLQRRVACVLDCC